MDLEIEEKQPRSIEELITILEALIFVANEPIAAILKSSAFAALCAHGLIGVTPSTSGSIGLGSDRLPGPFFLAPMEKKLPSESEWKQVAAEIHSWYQRNASSDHLAATVATALDSTA